MQNSPRPPGASHGAQTPSTPTTTGTATPHPNAAQPGLERIVTSSQPPNPSSNGQDPLQSSPASSKSTKGHRHRRRKGRRHTVHDASKAKDAEMPAVARSWVQKPFRWFLRQASEPNFIKIHYLYILGWIFGSAVLIVACGGIQFIDALFLASSACTQGGMTT